MAVQVAAPAPRVPARGAVLLAGWILWVACIAIWYFTVPGEWLVLVDREVSAAPHWLDALVRAVRAVVALAAVMLAAWGVGRTAVRPIAGLFTRRGELAQFSLLAGLALLSIALLSLAGVGAYRPMPATLAVALGACWGAALIVRAARDSSRPAIAMSGDVLTLAFLVTGAAALSFALVAALAPEIEYDALWYHLWLPGKWLAAGRPLDIVAEYPSLYPLGWDLLNGPAMVIGGTAGAKLLHFTCLLLLAASTAMLSRHLFPRASTAAAAAMAVTPPLMVWEASTAYVDLALAWSLSLAGYALLRYLETRRAGWLVASALAMGYALSIKHLALVVMAIMGVVLLVGEWRASRSIRRAARTGLLFGLMALALPSPWYARAYTASGNPVFPDLYSVFGAAPPERWSDATERGLQAFKGRFGRERTLPNLLALPWDATVHGARYGGTLGPVFLALLPLALAGGGAARLLLLACGAYALVWASPISSFQMRFLVPLVPWLAALCAEGLRHLPAAAGWVTAGLLVLNLPPFVEWHEADRAGWNGWLTHVLRGVPAGVVVGAESEAGYLARVVPSYRAWRYIDSALPSGSKVLTFSGGDHLYSATDRVWSDSTVARAATWGTPPGREAEARAALVRLGVTHVLFDKRQLASRDGKLLAIASPDMLSCCLSQVYEDERFVLYRVQ